MFINITPQFYRQLGLVLLIILLIGLPTTAQTRHKDRTKQGQQDLIDANLPNAFAPNWEFTSKDTTRLPALVEATAIYLPLSNGKVVSLNNEKGDLRWESEVGGTIIAPLIATNENILVAKRTTDSGTPGKGCLLQAISKQSGLTQWTKDFTASFSTPLVLDNQIVYVGSEDQSFQAINSQSGEVIWTTNLTSTTSGLPLIKAEQIFVGSETGTLYALARQDGHQLWQFVAKGALQGAVSSDSHYIYFGDYAGYVYCLSSSTGKLRWQRRTGASIEAAPQLIGRLAIVASFDNFIYGLNAQNGNTEWKLRLPGRLKYNPIIRETQLIVTPVNSNQVIIISNQGKSLGQFTIEADEILAPPSLLQDQLFMVTETGLLSARAQELKPNKDKTKKHKKKHKTNNES